MYVFSVVVFGFGAGKLPERQGKCFLAYNLHTFSVDPVFSLVGSLLHSLCIRWSSPLELFSTFPCNSCNFSTFPCNSFVGVLPSSFSVRPRAIRAISVRSRAIHSLEFSPRAFQYVPVQLLFPVLSMFSPVLYALYNPVRPPPPPQGVSLPLRSLFPEVSYTSPALPVVCNALNPVRFPPM